MRVALSGSAGTGKTTLAKHLAERHGLPYLEEGFRRRREAGLDPHALSRDEHKALLLELYDEAINDMAEAVTAHGGFIADRGPLDYLAFWMHYGFWSDCEGTQTFYERCHRDLGMIDMLVLLPWGVIELEADGIRSTNPWLQLKFQSLLEGLTTRADRTPYVLWMDRAIVSPDDRLAHVDAAIRDRDQCVS